MQLVMCHAGLSGHLARYQRTELAEVRELVFRQPGTDDD
jgi:hypothetical protein